MSPIDPSIPFAVRPATIDLQGAYAAAQQRREGDQRQQINQLQLQTARDQASERQRVLDRRKGVDAALAPAQGDLVKMREALPAVTAVDPEFGFALGKHLDEMDTRTSEIEQTKLARRVEGIGRAAVGVLALPPEQHEAAWATARQGVIANGIIKADEIPEQYPGDEALTSLISSAQTVQQHLSAIAAEKKAKVDAEDKATDNARQAAKDKVDAADKAADNARAEAEAKALAEYRQKSLDVEWAKAKAARDKSADKDPALEQDFKEYKEFLGQHEHVQRTRTTPNPAGFGAPVQLPYDAPPSFDEWRLKNKGRGTVYTTPTAPTRMVSPGAAERRTPATGAPTAPQFVVGQQVTMKGKRYTIGKVYPDGSWDPK